MKTLFKWLLWLTVAVVLVATVMSVVLTFFLQENDYKSLIQNWVETRTGRTFEIQGEVGIYPGIGLTLYAEDIRLGNVSWSDRADMLRASRVEARLSLAELLQGHLAIEQVLIQGLMLLVEQNAKGQYNIGISSSPDGERPIEVPEWIKIRSVTIEESQIEVDQNVHDWDVRIDQGRLHADGPNVPLQIDLQASLNTVPLAVTGTLGTLTTWWQRQESMGDLILTVRDSGQIRATGTVGDVLGWRDVEVELAGGISELREIAPWFRIRLLKLEQARLTARLVQPSTFSSMSLEDLKGRADYYGVPFQVEGRIGRLSRWSDFDLRLYVEDAWDHERSPLGDFANFRPAIHMDANVTGNFFGLHMDIIRLEVMATGVHITGQGLITNASRVWDQGLPLQVWVEDLQSLGKTLGRNWVDLGEIRGQGILAKEKTGFALQSVDLETTATDVSMSGKGSIQRLGPEQEGWIDITGTVDQEFFHRQGYLRFFRPNAAMVDAQWHIDGYQHSLNVDALSLQFPGGEFRGQGGIPDLEAPGKLTLNLEGRASNVQAFGSLHGWVLPALPELAATVLIEGQGKGHWTIRTMAPAVNQEGEYLTLIGEVDLSPGERVVNLQVRGMADTQVLSVWIPPEVADPVLASLDRVQATFMLRGSPDHALTLENLQLVAVGNEAKLEVEGAISAFQPLRGRLQVSLSGRPETWLRLLPDPLPPVEKVELAFGMSLPWDHGPLEDLSLRVHTLDGRLQLAGDILGVRPLRIDRMRLTMDYAELAAIPPFRDVVIPGNPVSVEGWLAWQAGRLSVDTTGQIGESQFEAKVDWQMARDGGRSTLDAMVGVDQLNLNSLRAKNRTNRKFVNTPLLPGWMFRMDGNLQLEIADYWGTRAHFRDIRVRSRMDAGTVDTSFVAGLGQGQFVGHLQSPGRGAMRMELGMTQFPVESLRTISDNDSLVGGEVDVSVTLQGKGMTLADLLAQGKGEIKIEIQNSRLDGNVLTTTGGDLLTSLIDTIRALGNIRDYTELECGVVYLDLEGGKAVTRNGLAIKTARVTVVGAGEVQFPGGKINFVLTPKAREGLGVSVTSIARSIRLGGTLNDPSVEISSQGLLTTGVNIASFIATGGASLIALGLYDRAHANSDVCAIARGGVGDSDHQPPAPTAGGAQ